jgi:hypothetical protein
MGILGVFLPGLPSKIEVAPLLLLIFIQILWLGILHLAPVLGNWASILKFRMVLKKERIAVAQDLSNDVTSN